MGSDLFDIIYQLSLLLFQIGDFGLAKKELFDDSSTPTSPTEVTPSNHSDQMNSTNHPTLQRKPSQHTSGVGTQAYAAPEQLTKGQIDFKSDMYSLGIILFELFNAFTTAMERSCAISSLRNSAALAESKLLPAGTTYEACSDDQK